MRFDRVRWIAFTISFFVTPSFGLWPSATVALAEAADHESLMREGVKLRRSGDDASALKAFQQAYELNKTPRAVAQIGLAEQALGRWNAADKHLREALESGDDPWILKNRAAIDAALAVVDGHLGQLEVSGTPAGAEVRVDGEVVGQLPLPRPIRVPAGGVAVEVGAAGYLPIVRAATISARTLTRETFKLQPLSPSASQGAAARETSGAAGSPPRQPDAVGVPLPAAGGATAPGGSSDGTNPGDPSSDPSSGPAQPAGGMSGRRVLVLVAGGLAVASLAFGIFEHVSWQHKVSSFGSMSACGATFPNRGGTGCKELYEDGQSAQTLAFVGYGLTAAFAATAAILFFTDSGGGTEPSKVACAPISATAGLGCAFRF